MNTGRTQWEVREAGNGKYTHTHTHTQCVSRDTQDGWSLGEGSDVILTQVGVAALIIKLMGYEHREIAVGGGRAGNGKHTHTHTVSPVIHRVDGASGKVRTQS